MPGIPDELGAHVSAAGGTHNAPGRGAELDAAVIQIFTKQPNRWAEREVLPAEAEAFRSARSIHAIGVAASHDSYLINLASPDEALFRRSLASFMAEVRRSEALGLDFLVTHPGNATDGDARRGIRQNADAITHTLDRVPGSIRILLEGTAGTGSALGSTFQELGELIRRIGDQHPDRVGVCLDTCHLWAAGYDLRSLEEVVQELDHHVGVANLRLMHLNDSVTGLGSRRDRHAEIAHGTMGDAVFRTIMTSPLLADVPKIIETPKGEDPVAADRRNLARLRSYRAGPAATA